SVTGVQNNSIRITSEPFADETIDAGLVSASGAAAGTPTMGTQDDTFLTGNMTLGNLVWVDSNENGRQDEGEPGLENVRVELYTKDPYFPCSIHSGAVFVDDDGTIYTDHSYLYRSDELLGVNR